MCKFQLMITNKNMKSWQNPQIVYNKDTDQTVPPHNRMPIFIQRTTIGLPAKPHLNVVSLAGQ